MAPAHSSAGSKSIEKFCAIGVCLRLPSGPSKSSLSGVTKRVGGSVPYEPPSDSGIIISRHCERSLIKLRSLALERQRREVERFASLRHVADRIGLPQSPLQRFRQSQAFFQQCAESLPQVPGSTR